MTVLRRTAQERRTPTKMMIPGTKMMIPGIRCEPVTTAKVLEPVDPAEAQELGNLESRRESIRDSTPSPARSASAAGLQVQG